MTVLRHRNMVWIGIVGVIVILGWMFLPDQARRLPDDWTFDLATHINQVFNWLARKAKIGPFAVKDITRGLAAAIELPLDLVRGLLIEGFRLRLPGLGRVEIAALPWWALTAVWAMLAHRLGGRGAAALVLGSCAYFLVFDLWDSAMLTLASVSLSVVVGMVLGLFLGIWAYRHPRIEAVLTVIYDIMQTMPVFSYLVPILLFFGFGPVSALVATVIYAMPPMARNTTLALRRLPGSATDLATMAGCTPRQGMWLVLLPSARNGLLSGLNQVIMLSLSAVIIASIIGAGGLGNDVLQGLKSMRLGRALEAGLAITLMAIALDRLSRAAARQRRDNRAPVPFDHRLALPGILLIGLLAAQIAPGLSEFPTALTLSTGRLIDAGVAWLNVALQGPIDLLSDGTVRLILRPVKEALLALPWLVIVLACALGAYALQGLRLAAVAVAILGFVLLTGYWDQAMISLYLVLVSTLIAMLLGFPVGIAAGLWPWLDRPVTLIIDTLQTLPTFVYLIPVVMLFGLGDFPALIAIVLYALPVMIRYTKDGIAHVPGSLIEAADMAGCSPRQRLAFVQIPQALPEILLGVSQTILMAFSMLVITSLVGTRGLEQEALVAVSKAKVGEGLIAGSAISLLSILLDRLVSHASTRLRRHLGQV